MGKDKRKLIIYQAKSGAIEFRGDFDAQTIWGTQKQIANIFNVNSQAITKHIRNIYKEGELKESQTCSILEQVQKEGNKTVKRKLSFYNLDMIVSVGYRINSKQATQFRIWATSVLKKHLIDGYTINKKRISKNYENFLQAITSVRALLSTDSNVKIEDILELINVFAETWFSLESYDKNIFPRGGISKKTISFTADELLQILAELKKELITKK